MTLNEAIKWKKIKDFPNYSVLNTELVRTSIQNVLSGLSENARGYHFRRVV